MFKQSTRRALLRVDRLVTAIEDFLLGIAGAGLAVIMVLITLSAIARYAFSQPVGGSQIWTAEFLAPMVTFFALSAALRARRHIGVTIVVTKLPPGVRLATQTLAAVVTATVFLVVAYEGALRTQAAFESNQVQPIVNFPLWIAYAVVPIGSFLVSVRTVIIGLQWWTGDRDKFALATLHEGSSAEVAS